MSEKLELQLGYHILEQVNYVVTELVTISVYKFPIGLVLAVIPLP